MAMVLMPARRVRRGKKPSLSDCSSWWSPAHPDLGKLGVFWHTQGSGKSYSMAFFAEKVRRQISAKFTFLADDGPQRSGQTDLPNVRWLRGGG